MSEQESAGNKTESSSAITTIKENEYNQRSLSSLNLFDAKQLEQAKALIEIMMRSEKGGIKSVNDGIAILLRAQDLNLPFSSCIEHIHVINGKTGVDIHIIKSLLLKAGITWNCVKDYVPLYEYTDSINVFIEDKLPDYCIKCKSAKEASEKASKNDSDEHVYVYPVRYYSDFNGNIYKDYQLTGAFAVAANKQHATEIAKNGKCPVYRIPSQPVDYITEYELVRHTLHGVMKSKGHFSYSEALAADLFGKDTYKKYARIMIGNRAFVYAARDIASDLLMGCMETSELKIVEDASLNPDDFIPVEEA